MCTRRRAAAARPSEPRLAHGCDVGYAAAQPHTRCARRCIGWPPGMLCNAGACLPADSPRRWVRLRRCFLARRRTWRVSATRAPSAGPTRRWQAAAPLPCLERSVRPRCHSRRLFYTRYSRRAVPRGVSARAKGLTLGLALGAGLGAPLGVLQEWLAAQARLLESHTAMHEASPAVPSGAATATIGVLQASLGDTSPAPATARDT